MKRIIHIAALLLFSFGILACSQSNPENHGDLSGLKTFEYQGYTYYLHSVIGKYNYSDATENVNNLSSYGYTSWFIPSIDELNMALGAGLIDIYSDYQGYWSSSQAKSNFKWILSFDQFENKWEHNEADLRATCWTLPMIRVRQQ